MHVKINSKPANLISIQVYGLEKEYNEKEINRFYEEVKNYRKKNLKTAE